MFVKMVYYMEALFSLVEYNLSTNPVDLVCKMKCDGVDFDWSMDEADNELVVHNFWHRGWGSSVLDTHGRPLPEVSSMTTLAVRTNYILATLVQYRVVVQMYLLMRGLQMLVVVVIQLN
jgi:hypothetical protein